jgi:poly(3-hydroxybutyrate) depolymerase
MILRLEHEVLEKVTSLDEVDYEKDLGVALKEVVQFWVEANKSQSPADIREKGTVTTSVYSAVTGGAVTEFVVDAEGGHGWPSSRSRRDGNAPIKSFSGAERVWEFFKDKHR